MKIQGVIFDFNGTLFWDTAYQNNSWEKFLEIHNVILSPEEFKEYVHGRNGKDTLEYIFKRKISQAEANIMIEEKEILYRQECEENKLELAPGSISFLAYLLENKIKIAIATASGKSNIDYFIEKFNLYKYFDNENIIYNDGRLRGKPYPDLFMKAIDSIQVSKENIIIFEDSQAGIEAAHCAKVRDVIIVDSSEDNFEMYNYKRVSHFDQVDRSIFY